MREGSSRLTTGSSVMTIEATVSMSWVSSATRDETMDSRLPTAGRTPEACELSISAREDMIGSTGAKSLVTSGMKPVSSDNSGGMSTTGTDTEGRRAVRASIILGIPVRSGGLVATGNGTGNGNGVGTGRGIIGTGSSDPIKGKPPGAVVAVAGTRLVGDEVGLSFNRDDNRGGTGRTGIRRSGSRNAGREGISDTPSSLDVPEVKPK